MVVSQVTHWGDNVTVLSQKRGMSWCELCGCLYFLIKKKKSSGNKIFYKIIAINALKLAPLVILSHVIEPQNSGRWPGMPSNVQSIVFND